MAEHKRVKAILKRVLVALVLLYVLFGDQERTEFDLYTGMSRTRHTVCGIFPLPYIYHKSEEDKWALANMKDPAKRRWVFGCSSSGGLLFPNLMADGFPLDAVTWIYISDISSEEKLRYLKEWHRDLDALSEDADLQHQLYEPWQKKVETLPRKR